MNKDPKSLNNTYVREYYDVHVGGLDDYSAARWHNSAAAEFEYRQTSRAIDRALGEETYSTAVEIGPGDAVWTKKLRARVSGRIHLIEQSEEMLKQARGKLTGVPDITFEYSDLMESNPPRGVDLIFASRCFEYFTDKKAALVKMRDIIRPGGILIIITKNSKLFTSVNAQRKVLHSDQVSKKEMKKLLAEAGFTVDHVYPATLRWKVKYAPFRILFDFLHRITVWSNGYIQIPFLFTYATESYTYISSRLS